MSKRKIVKLCPKCGVVANVCMFAEEPTKKFCLLCYMKGEKNEIEERDKKEWSKEHLKS